MLAFWPQHHNAATSEHHGAGHISPACTARDLFSGTGPGAKTQQSRRPSSPDDINPRKLSFGLVLGPIVLTPLALRIMLFYFGDLTPATRLATIPAIPALAGLDHEPRLGQYWGNMEEGVFRVINVSLPFGSVLIEAPLVS